MSTENARARRFGGLEVRWYHLVFALAFGGGAGILPPDGATTFAGWAGGFVGSLTSALVVAGVVLAVTRRVDDWRPSRLAGHDGPDSRTRFLVCSALAAQLFVLGTALAADVNTGTAVLLVSAVNPVVAVTVLGDMLRLRDRGIEWTQREFGFPVAALLVGVLGGLAYWYRRGRKRAEGIEAGTTASTADTDDPDGPADGEGDGTADEASGSRPDHAEEE